MWCLIAACLKCFLTSRRSCNCNYQQSEFLIGMDKKDILEPELVWVGKRCYRVNNNGLEANKSKQKTEKVTVGGYTEHDLYDDDEDSEEFEITVTDRGYFKTSFHVPSAFYGRIIGTKGITKKRIESETKSQILIPRHGLEGDIVITGPNRQSVTVARTRVNAIVLGARNSRRSDDLTHMVCVPFNGPIFQTQFNKFREEILLKYPELDTNLFVPANKLHLTIGVLALMDNNDRALAGELLHECGISVVKPILEKSGGKCEIELSGLNIMNDDPSSVHVLYGMVKSEPLQLIADGIMEKFISKGLVKREYDHVKLHVTLLNAKYCTERGDRKPFPKFDATGIMDNFLDYHFGSQELTGIPLSQFYSKGADGFYETTAILNIKDYV